MIQQVRARFNGQWVLLTYDKASGTWQGEFTPSATSFTQPHGAYSIEVEAVNSSGAIVTATGEDREDLRLFVNERQPPRLVLVSPAEGYVTVNRPEIVVYGEDEPGGSGVDIASLEVWLDGQSVSGAVWQPVQGGYRVAYTPDQPLSEGPHTLEFRIADQDKNTAMLRLRYTVDTLPPALFLKEPRYRSVVDTPSILVSGTATDPTQPVTLRAEVNGVLRAQATALPPFGTFSWDIPLEVGANTIQVTAADGVGWESLARLFVIRLVTDRTQGDVDALASLLQKPVDRWTPEERSAFLTARERGGYNYTDLNRVVLAVEHLNSKFGGYGYDGGYVPVEPQPGRTQWQPEDYPEPAKMEAFLDNLRRLKGLVPIRVPLPETMEGLTFQRANDIEAVLVALDRYSPYMENSFRAGEIHAGET